MDIHSIGSIIEKSPSIYEILKYCPYDILKRWSIKDYAKGQVIFRQGEIYDSFCIAVSGYIDIYVMAENGKRYSQAIYTTGDFIGELEIFDEKPFGCFVEAISDVRLLEIKREYFLQWIELDKNISEYITRTLCSQFYNLSKKAGQDTLYSLKQRLCYYLITCTKSRSGIIEKIDIQKDKLSEQMAVTQRSINRVLQYLKEKGIIDIENNTVIIKDMDALKIEEEVSRHE
ncbi:MAG TPA: Crp/Fnr family transcriptional regulator [Clostridia bacterium]|nr:Crp/Fnr family transcriptional regulator [Clostridia bacterium]